MYQAKLKMTVGSVEKNFKTDAARVIQDLSIQFQVDEWDKVERELAKNTCGRDGTPTEVMGTCFMEKDCGFCFT